MKIFKINDVKKFGRFILQCKGNIWYIDHQQRRQDLKAIVRFLQDKGLEDSFRFPEGIEICADESLDAQALIRYLMNDGHTADFHRIA